MRTVSLAVGNNASLDTGKFEFEKQWSFLTCDSSSEVRPIRGRILELKHLSHGSVWNRKRQKPAGWLDGKLK